jgi:hypothetical protein
MIDAEKLVVAKKYSIHHLDLPLFLWVKKKILLVPKLLLGNASLEATASRRIGSWSFQAGWSPILRLGTSTEQFSCSDGSHGTMARE